MTPSEYLCVQEGVKYEDLSPTIRAGERDVNYAAWFVNGGTRGKDQQGVSGGRR